MSEELSTLVTMASREEAGMLRELLENEGIACVVSSSLDPYYGALSPLGTRISVRTSDWERANEIYQAYFGGAAEEIEGEGDSRTE